MQVIYYRFQILANHFQIHQHFLFCFQNEKVSKGSLHKKKTSDDWDMATRTTVSIIIIIIIATLGPILKTQPS